MSNQRIAEIEEMQRELREKADGALKDGKPDLCLLFRGLADFCETNKLFVNSDELLRVYRNVLNLNPEVEINGAKWPIALLVPATSNESLTEVR